MGSEMCIRDRIKSLRRHSQKQFDAHLMVSNPDALLADYATAGADRITVHVEACPHLDRSLERIHDLGCKAGVALNPHSGIDDLVHVLDRLDLVLVMTVNPGFGGQAFIASMTNKIAEVKSLIGSRRIDIQVDGGITASTTALVTAAGANVLVAGSAIFNEDDPSAYAANIAAIRSASAL